MNAFWLEFTDGSKACCEGYNERDAAEIAKKVSGKEVAKDEAGKLKVTRLPYPAEPVIWRFAHPVHGVCPTFCFKPNECKGKTACPQNYSCTE